MLYAIILNKPYFKSIASIMPILSGFRYLKSIDYIASYRLDVLCTYA